MPYSFGLMHVELGRLAAVRSVGFFIVVGAGGALGTRDNSEATSNALGLKESTYVAVAHELGASATGATTQAVAAASTLSVPGGSRAWRRPHGLEVVDDRTALADLPAAGTIPAERGSVAGGLLETSGGVLGSRAACEEEVANIGSLASLVQALTSCVAAIESDGQAAWGQRDESYKKNVAYATSAKTVADLLQKLGADEMRQTLQKAVAMEKGAAKSVWGGDLGQIQSDVNRMNGT